MAFLKHATARLAGSLEFGETLESVARLAVPELADWCVLDAVEDGRARMLAVAHADPAKEALVRKLRVDYPLEMSRPYGLAHVLKSGEPLLYAHIDPGWRDAAARDAEHLRLMAELDAGSSICVPLQARGRTLGAMTFVRTGRVHAYDSDDLEFAMDLAHSCALALDNARLYGAAQDAIAVRDQVLAAVSHDLRNPLTSISGTAQLVRIHAERTQPPARELLVQRMTEIESIAGRMAAMIGELLDAARLRDGHTLELIQRPVDLVQLARRVVAENQRKTDRHQIVVQTDAEQIVGSWDRARLERVIDNLLSNAVKYSQSGGEVSVWLGEEGAAAERVAVLVVRDRGIGIPTDDRPHLFEPFRRAGNVTGRIAGTGLGLFGARHIVELHGGTIAVESQEGVGSAFTVRLPVSTA